MNTSRVSQQDGLALTDACLDDGMDFFAIIKELRAADGCGLREAIDWAYTLLGESKHPKAAATLAKAPERGQRRPIPDNITWA